MPFTRRAARTHFSRLIRSHQSVTPRFSFFHVFGSSRQSVRQLLNVSCRSLHICCHPNLVLLLVREDTIGPLSACSSQKEGAYPLWFGCRRVWNCDSFRSYVREHTRVALCACPS